MSYLRLVWKKITAKSSRNLSICPFGTRGACLLQRGSHCEGPAEDTIRQNPPEPMRKIVDGKGLCPAIHDWRPCRPQRPFRGDERHRLREKINSIKNQGRFVNRPCIPLHLSFSLNLTGTFYFSISLSAPFRTLPTALVGCSFIKLPGIF